MFRNQIAIALVCATSLLAAANSSLAVQTKFLTVQANVNGPHTSQFTSLNGNGTIDVTHVHSAGGAAPADNVNTAISNKFTILFPGTGNNVDGHLAQTHYNNTIDVIFDLTGYNITGRTVFGMWNTTDEVSWPAGPGGPSQPVYSLKLNDGNNIVPPTTFQLIGNQDNQADVMAHTKLLMDPTTGDISPGPLVNGGSGVHMDAAFWKNIPAGTQQIILHGNLPPLNALGDGIGFYFADVPEPTSVLLVSLAGMIVATCRRRR